MTQSPARLTVPILRGVLLFEVGVFRGVADVLFAVVVFAVAIFVVVADVVFWRSQAIAEDSDMLK